MEAMPQLFNRTKSIFSWRFLQMATSATAPWSRMKNLVKKQAMTEDLSLCRDHLGAGPPR